MRIIPSAVLKEFHIRIERGLDIHRSSRGDHPVHLLEHDLSQPDLDQIALIVGTLVALDPNVESLQWRISSLPLLVLAAEIGYEYQGTGTDFWPLLDARLQVEIGSKGRANIAALYRIAQKNWGIAGPGNSAWERHFPYISWPIANALVPKEFHAPLSEALRQVVRAGVSTTEGDLLVEAIREIAAGYGSRRFESWLRRDGVAFEVIRMLLSPGAQGWLSRAVIDRIDADLFSNRRAARALADVRATVSRRSGSSLRVARARFQLLLEDGAVAGAAIQGPVLDQQAQAQMIAELRFRGNRIRALSSRAFIPLERFLSGGRLEISTSFPFPVCPLRRGDEPVAPGAKAPPDLDKIQPAPATVFVVEPGGRSALALHKSDSVATAAELLLLTDANGQAAVRRLVPGKQSDADLIRNAGITLKTSSRAPQIFGLPVTGLQNVFAAGFPILSPKVSDDTFARLDNDFHPLVRLRFGRTDCALWTPEAGDHVLATGLQSERLTTPFSILDRPRSEPASIHIVPDTAGIEDLLSGRLEIRVCSPIPLDGCSLQLTVDLPNGRSVSVDGEVDGLPTVIAGRSPLLAQLADALGTAGCDRDAGALLSVRLPGFASRRLRLKSATRTYYRDSNTGAWYDLRDDGDPRPVTSLYATPDHPLLAPDTDTPDAAPVTLCLPAGMTADALSCGVVIRPGTSVRFQPRPRAAAIGPLVREADDHAGRRGLISVVTSWLGWRLATAPDPLSDWLRRNTASELERAVVEQLCGNTWREAEAGVELDVLTRAACIQSAAQRHLKYTDTELPVISDRGDRKALREYLNSRFADALAQLPAAMELDNDAVAVLDEALDLGWQDLRSRISRSGRAAFDELDLNLNMETWQIAIAEAEAMPVLPLFRRFILPASRWEALSDADYSGQSISQIVDLLDACHLDAHRRSGARLITRAELRALIELWIAPAKLIEDEDWKVLLARGLSDVQTARATRYAALRSMISRHDLPQREAV